MNERRRKSIAMIALAAVISGQLGTTRTYARQDARDVGGRDDEARHIPTATPIKHLIVVIGENRGFDHVFGAYIPRPDQGIANLLSRGIINKDGSPGPNFGEAAQFTVAPQAKYFIGAPDGSKTELTAKHVILASGSIPTELPVTTAASRENYLGAQKASPAIMENVTRMKTMLPILESLNDRNFGPASPQYNKVRGALVQFGLMSPDDTQLPSAQVVNK